MTGARISRRRMMAGIGRCAAGVGAALTWPGSSLRAQTRGTAGPLTIGIITEESGENALLGAADRRGIELAIDAANRAGGVLGHPVAAVSFDTRTRPGYVARTLPGFIKRHDLTFLIGGTSGGVADAVATAAQALGAVYLDSNSRASSVAAACHRTRFSWSMDGGQLARATVLNVHRVFGPGWVLVVEDSLWGRRRAEFQRRLIDRAGGMVVGEVPVSADGTGLAFVYDAISAVAPDNVFPAVGRPVFERMVEGARERGLEDRAAWVVPAPDWPRLAEWKPEDVFGVFPVTWYWRLERYGVPDLVKAYWRAYPDAEPRMPGSFVYNGYMAARALFQSVTQAATVESHAIIRELEGRRFSAAQRLQHGEAWMDAATHTLRQPVYLATANPKPRHPEDLFHLLGWVGAGEGAGSAVRECSLEPMAETPNRTG